MNYAQKIEKLRQKMTLHGVQGYIVPRTDEYQGEYVADYAERLAWLTGFTGSAGIAMVLADQAVVMSDGRYTIQLSQQVDLGLYHAVNSQEVKPQDWLKTNIDKDCVVGYDPKLFTPSQIAEFQKAEITLKAIDRNLIDVIWEDQPAPPKGKVTLFPEKFAGVSALEKIKNIQAALKEKECAGVILTLSDSIAWLLNIRGQDIAHIPVALSYLIVPVTGKVEWFIDLDKLTNEVKGALEAHVIFIAESKIAEALQVLKGRVWFDPKRSSEWFQNQLKEVREEDDPCILPRACKNEAEQNAMKQAHIRDGVAMVKFLQWFHRDHHNIQLNELSVEEKLEGFRAEALEYKESSFSTIAGYGPNGAIVHYRATEKTSLKIEEGNLLLLDSGGQYEDGTTDITRTMAFGMPTKEMIEHNTLVLKGHINLASAIFKKGTLGKELDELARAPLQKKGLNYSHGTGHGVGCYLSVHEDAAHISPRGQQALQAGMILSNEPGYYKEGAYGIRIENLVLVKENADGDLYFETLTLVPFDRSLIDVSLLNENEKQWVNNYHARVYEMISPLLDDIGGKWLKEATKAI